jgi:hypothetical protein
MVGRFHVRQGGAGTGSGGWNSCFVHTYPLPYAAQSFMHLSSQNGDTCLVCGQVPRGKGKLVEVLSLGCGPTALVPMMAVRAAKELGEGPALHVTGVESSENQINNAAEVVSSHGHGANMTLVHKDSRQLSVGEIMGGVAPELIRRADMLILENFDYGLLGEGLLPTLHHAFTVRVQRLFVAVPFPARPALNIELSTMDVSGTACPRCRRGTGNCQGLRGSV